MGCFATTPVGRLIRPHSGLSKTYTWRPVTAAIRPLPTPSKYPNSLDGPQAATRIVSPDSRNRLAHTVIFCSCRSSLIVSSFRYRAAARAFRRKFWMLATVTRAGRPGLSFGAQGGGGFGSCRPAGWQECAEDRDGQGGQREQDHFGGLVDVHDRCRHAGEGGRDHGAAGDRMQDHRGGGGGHRRGPGGGGGPAPGPGERLPGGGAGPPGR